MNEERIKSLREIKVCYMYELLFETTEAEVHDEATSVLDAMTARLSEYIREVAASKKNHTHIIQGDKDHDEQMCIILYIKDIDE